MTISTDPTLPRFYISNTGYLYRLIGNEYVREEGPRFTPGIDINGKAIPTIDGRLYILKSRTYVEVDDQSGTGIDPILECVPFLNSIKNMFLMRTASKKLYQLEIKKDDSYNYTILEEEVEKLIGHHNGWAIAVRLPDRYQDGYRDPQWIVTEDSDKIMFVGAYRVEEDGKPYICPEYGEDLQPDPGAEAKYRGTVITYEVINVLVYDNTDYEQLYFEYVEGSVAETVACEVDELLYQESHIPRLLSIREGNLHFIDDMVSWDDAEPIYPELGPWKDIISIEGRACPLSHSDTLYCSYLKNGRVQLREVMDRI